VNLLGCFIIGLLSQVAESHDWLSPQAGSFVFVGLLGAFTTFSTFSNDSMNFFRQGDSLSAVFYIGVHVLVGLGFVWGGRFLAAQVWK
jgi:CrcB protein